MRSYDERMADDINKEFHALDEEIKSLRQRTALVIAWLIESNSTGERISSSRIKLAKKWFEEK